MKRNDRMASENLFRFVTAFSLMIDTGLSLVGSFQTIREEMGDADEEWREALEFVQTEIELGSTLSRAFAKRPRLFPPDYVGMVRAGEVTGRLELTLRRYSDYLKREKELLGE